MAFKEVCFHYFNTSAGPVRLSLRENKKDKSWNWKISTVYHGRFSEVMHDSWWKTNLDKAIADGNEAVKANFRDVVPIEVDSFEQLLLGEEKRIHEFKDRVEQLLETEFKDLHMVNI